MSYWQVRAEGPQGAVLTFGVLAPDRDEAERKAFGWLPDSFLDTSLHMDVRDCAAGAGDGS